MEMEGDGLNYSSCNWNQQISDFIEPKIDNFSLYLESADRLNSSEFRVPQMDEHGMI